MSESSLSSVVAPGRWWPGAAARPRSLRVVLALVVVTLTVLIGRVVLDSATFPLQWSLPVGDVLQAGIDAFAENGEWLYAPFASGLASAFDFAFDVLWYTPAPTLAVGILAIVFVLAGWRLAVLTAAFLTWTIVVGMWETTVSTIAFMVVAVVVSCILGVALGIVASTNRRVDAAVRTILDWMQAFPIIAYFVPVVVVLGTGDAPALVVTVIWALPPVARMTAIGLREVSSDTVEAARSLGTTRSQLLWHVRLPLAQPSIAAGINQTIMFAISMATIAAMIGGSGLGQPVWEGLSRLDFGRALEAGIALVLLAVILDRVSAPKADKVKFSVVDEERPSGIWPNLRRQLAAHRRAAGAAAVFIVFAAVVSSVPSLTNVDFTMPPAWMEVDLRGPVTDAVLWVSTNLGGFLDATRSAIWAGLLSPLIDVLRWVPWVAVVAFGVIIGAVAIGIRGAIFVGAGLALIGLMGMWDAAVVTVALVGVAALIALVIGIPLGVLMSRSDRAAAIMRPVLDVTQTMPIFLFVIPAVLFLGSGAVAGTIATVLYAIPPTIRLTNVALRNADAEVVEAATSFAASRWQILRDVRIPLGLPTILIGINQTVLLAMSMVVVAALIGTPGLGQELLIAVGSTDFGGGLEAGIAMFLLAVIFDRVFTGFIQRLTAGSHLGNA